MEWLRYKENMHTKYVRHKPQGHVRVSDDNNEENKEKTTARNFCTQKGQV